MQAYSKIRHISSLPLWSIPSDWTYNFRQTNKRRIQNYRHRIPKKHSTPSDSRHMQPFIEYYDTAKCNSPRTEIEYVHTPAFELLTPNSQHCISKSATLGPFGMNLTLLPTFLHATTTTIISPMTMSTSQMSTALTLLIHPRLLTLPIMPQQTTLSSTKTLTVAL